ncbi:uncharacterized protein [Pyrus communis]|uniref:uncharacterized protein isoform X2 n=1 Tax=Pyrus communis TaxID=23211 RepID=UPI0035C18AA9
MYKMTCLAVAPHSSVQHNGSGRKDQQLRPGCKGGGDGLPDQKGLRSSVLGIPYQVHPPHTFSLGQFPTPIHKWNLPSLAPNTEVWLKVLAFFSLAKGLGYAINTSEELNVVKEIAATTGVVLDSVYRSVSADNLQFVISKNRVYALYFRSTILSILFRSFFQRKSCLWNDERHG